MASMRHVQVLAAMAVLTSVGGCSRADVVRVATNVRVGAERVGSEAEQARAIQSLNDGALSAGAVRSAPQQPADAAAAQAPKTPLWLQPGSPYAPSAPSSAPVD